MKPHLKSGFWFSSLGWLMIQRPFVSRELKGSKNLISTWKKILKHIVLGPPTSATEVLSTSIWLSRSFIGSNFNFFVDRAKDFIKIGLYSIKDL